MSKDTLSFYSGIYEPLFKRGSYSKKSNRSAKSYGKLEELQQNGELEDIDSIIDIGCSWGRNLKYWKEKGYKIVGVDVSSSMVGRLTSKGYEVYLSSATDLSVFPDNTFDLYMASDVFEHLRTEDLDDAIEEAKRISKKYILVQPHTGLDKRGKRDIKKALHLTLWNMEQWEMFFKSHGLSFIKLSDDKNWWEHIFLMRVE